MNVLHLSTSERSGGAAKSANRLHHGLRRLGVESRMAVLHRQSDDATVDMLSDRRLLVRGVQAAQRRWRAQAFRLRYGATRPPRLELFSDGCAPWPDALVRALPRADVYNAHWVARFLDYVRFFRRLPAGTPFVWTLRDMNPFTGGCHYDLDCGRWRNGCGACPQLGSSKLNDLSTRVFRRKAMALARLRPETTRVVALSAWLQSAAQRSPLFSRFQVERIPNGVDTDVFQPRDPGVARSLFGLPATGPVVLFAADSVANHRKGFDLLQRALARLEQHTPVTLAAIGGGPVEMPESVASMVALGRIDDQQLLSHAYGAADLFVMATRAEAFGQVVLEAMASGTPVVSFDVGGVPDMVRPGVTGLLAPPEDVGALARAIATLLDDPELRRKLGHQARAVAVAEYRLELEALRYRALYEDLIAASRARATMPS